MRGNSEDLQAVLTAYETIDNPSLKQAIQLTVIEDMTIDEAANHLGVTYKTVARRRERGLNLIKERYANTRDRGSASSRCPSQVPEVHTGHAGLVEA
jgi:DNA-directed RNA polymerase specialized sigma24 family protein